MSNSPRDSLKCKRTLAVAGKNYTYFSLEALEKMGLKGVSRLPCSLKVLLENLLRFEDDQTVTMDDIKAIATWGDTKKSQREIAFRPTRVLMQDFTGVPGIVDLAAMRDAVVKLGGDPSRINPLVPVDLVIDHSVQVDEFATHEAFKDNVHIEMKRNHERYEFLRWGQTAFNNFRVVPPGTGICHQINLEYLAKVVWVDENGVASPDTLVGTDSHTTMINGVGVLGWGVGGIEAEAAMLGQPISMLIPEVIGFKLEGELPEGITATDLVLTITEMLRKKGVVGKFVEFYGDGLAQLPLATRATIANMAPEYGATCGYFPIDEMTIDYLRLTGREDETIAVVEAYAKTQGLWRHNGAEEPVFTDTLALNLSSIEPCLAGPKRPQDRVSLKQLATTVAASLPADAQKTTTVAEMHELDHGAVVIAAITSCTNTSNPSVLMAAGLVAKKALSRGLQRKPWVKTSLAPGSKVVTDYLQKAGLQTHLDELGFDLVGYGCTTCIGNSGPLPDAVSKAIVDRNLNVSSVLSGNRNFEGRVHPLTKDNWLASPPLVVAFAIAGTTRINLVTDPIGIDTDGKSVMLKDIWPTDAEIAAEVAKIRGDMFREEYADVFTGDAEWQAIAIKPSQTYAWNADSTYVKNPPYFDDLSLTPTPLKNIEHARILAIFGDSITTDHISPAGNIKADSPAGKYLQEHGIAPKDFNSYGARRGNHEVMMRGTFANIRIRNEMLAGVEGGMTRFVPTGEAMSIFNAAMLYQKMHIPLVIIAGKEYGTGSSRDWAAKGPALLGVKAVVAESFERIHRSNLIGMGIVPLQFLPGTDRKTLHLNGSEQINILGLEILRPGSQLTLQIVRENAEDETLSVLCRIDTQNELQYLKNGGILHYVLRQICQK